MYINRVLALFPVLVLFSFFTSCTAEDRAVLYPDEKPGVYLLSSPQGIVDLAARWAFYPGEFVPADTDPSRAARYEFFPAAWSNYHIPHDANHFGSYAIHLRNLDPSIQYAFLFPGYSSAVRYFVNGVPEEPGPDCCGTAGNGRTAGEGGSGRSRRGERG